MSGAGGTGGPHGVVIVRSCRFIVKSITVPERAPRPGGTAGRPARTVPGPAGHGGPRPCAAVPGDRRAAGPAPGGSG